MWKSERTNCSAASPFSFCFRSYLTAQTNTKVLAQPQLAGLVCSCRTQPIPFLILQPSPVGSLLLHGWERGSALCSSLQLCSPFSATTAACRTAPVMAAGHLSLQRGQPLGSEAPLHPAWSCSGPASSMALLWRWHGGRMDTEGARLICVESRALTHHHSSGDGHRLQDTHGSAMHGDRDKPSCPQSGWGDQTAAGLRDAGGVCKLCRGGTGEPRAGLHG